jgi:predicted transcriptional regulator
VLVHEAVDGGLKIDDRHEHAALQSAARQLGEEALDGVEDGKPYKSLKRHLTARGLTPAQYREKWSLPLDYPMVAPNYSKARSELAKAIGLGQTHKGKKAGKKRAA